MAAPEVVEELTRAAVTPRAVTVKKIKSVPAGCAPATCVIGIKAFINIGAEWRTSCTGSESWTGAQRTQHSGGSDEVWYNLGMWLLPAAVAHTYMFTAFPRNHRLSKAR